MQVVKDLLSIVFVVVIAWFAIMIGSAYEDHVKCMRGYAEYCIAEDFE